MTVKRCTKCYQIKPLSNFSRQTHGKMGRKSECKTCQVLANKKYRQANRRMVQGSVRQCYKCKAQLSPERALSERRRIQKEIQAFGVGYKMATCGNCQ